MSLDSRDLRKFQLCVFFNPTYHCCSMVIRTACSSSLTALHEACMSLHIGECESAIVGGTNMILNPHMTAAMTEQGVMSPDGKCKSFDASADEYSRGE